LSAYVIRIWEQRYRAVEPRRTATQRRLYSQREIERLNLLRDATQAGHSIGQVAQLPTDKLGKLVAVSPNLQARSHIVASCAVWLQHPIEPLRMTALPPQLENPPVGDHAAPRSVAQRLFGEFLVTQRGDVGHRAYTGRATANPWRRSISPSSSRARCSGS
jgi:DNA-binding transcriptional MerR regulator